MRINQEEKIQLDKEQWIVLQSELDFYKELVKKQQKLIQKLIFHLLN